MLRPESPMPAAIPLFLVLGLFIAGGAIAPAGAATMQVDLDYQSMTDLVRSLAAGDGLPVTRLPRYELLARPGAPALPAAAEQIVLPAGTVARSVRAIAVTSQRYPAGTIPPAQPPAILGMPGVTMATPPTVPPDTAIYDGTALYPAELVALVDTGHLAELDIAACAVHPVQYDPTTRELILHTEITLTLELETDKNPARAHPGNPHQPREMDRIVSNLANARMHGALPRTASPAWPAGQALALDPADYQYVIITTAPQAAAWETYAAWKATKGVPATVVTITWIDANYQGRDTAERIRNFIIAAVRDWGTTYVLLAGDEPLVPSRPAWAFDCEAGFHLNENDLYADHYYSDLDGSWDANRNDIFGEIEDEVDLYPDVFVGRASTSNLDQASAVVRKFLHYERADSLTANDYTMRALLFGEILWHNPFTDSGVGLDMVATSHFGPAYEPIERLYETSGNESVESVVTALNGGVHLAIHGGHAFHSVMGAGTGYLGPEDVTGLVNAPDYFVLYSIGCWAAALDYDSIGELFLTNSHGGAVAFIGNSRYGWGSPGNPGWGYSETFGSDLFGALLTEGMTQLGPALTWPKILRIPFSGSGNVYRWHQYQVNLLGDPEMSCHTAPITPLFLDAPADIPGGATEFVATVSDAEGSVAGARLCLAGPDLYQVGFSNERGQVIFTPVTDHSQTVTLTATAANHSYAQQMIGAAGNDANLVVAATTFSDDAGPPSAGDGDGAIEVGETLELFIVVQNAGGTECTGVTGTLTLDDTAGDSAAGRVTLIDSVATYGTVAVNEQATGATAFVFAVAAGCPAGSTLPLQVVFTDAVNTSWTAAVPLIVHAAAPGFDHYAAVIELGDRDRVIEPGETVSLTAYVANAGNAAAGPLTAVLRCISSDMLVTQPAGGAGDLAAGTVAALTPPFEIWLGPGASSTTYAEMELTLTYAGGSAGPNLATQIDTFLVAIGEPGFEDQMEINAGNWVSSGTNDNWRLSDHRRHSGSSSWYCGTAEHRYVDDSDAALTSPTFILPDDAQLSFWCYFDVTIYGTDGLFVECEQDGDWETLDYFGSGGALDPLLFVADWSERVYDLGHLTPGHSTRLRFRFISDANDTEEGFYVDDVVVQPATAPAIGPPEISGSFALSTTIADPAGAALRWRLNLPAAAAVAATIYDINGHLVERLRDGILPAGGHELRWDGGTVRGFAAPTGIYFLRLGVDGQETVRKVLRLR